MSTPEYRVPPFLADMPRVETFAEIDEVFRSADFIQGAHWESAPLYSGCLLMTDGREHMERRRIVSMMFSRPSLQHYETQALAPVITQVLEELAAKRSPDGLVRADLVPLLRIFLHRITALVTGADGVDTPARTQRFQSLVEKLEAAVGVEWSTRDHAEVLEEGIEARRELIAEFLQPSLDRRVELVRRHRAGEIERAELPIDLLTLLAQHGQDGHEGEDAYIWRECALFLVAATQTTSHAVPHVIKHLDEWWAAHPQDRALVDDPEFIRSAANESLRLHQPAPVLLRIAQKDVTLETSGRSFREGERIALFFTPANRDAGVYGADADAFNPHRPVAKKPPPWGLTFGGGVHLCIGRPLVTGLSSATDGGITTQGTMVRLLRALYASGIAPDPEHPPQRNAASYHDAFASMPIVLHRL